MGKSAAAQHPEHAEHGHDHLTHSGESLVDAAGTVLSQAGEQWTGMRRSVFEELAKHERPVSAYDMADALSATRGKRVAPNSIYRILDLFVENNLALRVESANAFLANTHPGCSHDCIFLVCDSCGQATHVDDDALTQNLRALSLKNEFQPERPIIEIRGFCADCR